MEFPKNKTIFREVTIAAGDRGLPDQTFELGFGPNGLTIRRKGETGSKKHLSWRQVIGHALIHCGGGGK